MENNFKKCKLCNDWHWTNSECPPEYFVYHEDYMGDECKPVRANSHEDAALKYAEYYNQDDYELMNETIEVKVVDLDGVVKFFVVGAEPDIHYSSQEINTLTGD